MKKFKTKSCAQIMGSLYKPIEFSVEGLIGPGVCILAGSPKVGKSWVALDLELCVSSGEKFIERPTTQGTVLYLCLEDSDQRVQRRLYELTEEPPDGLFFSTEAETIGNGLEEQIIKFKDEHPGLSLVIIDTLQMVRSDSESNYGNDYAELRILKELADRIGICILLVHHLRKAYDDDPSNMISGSTGLNGCVDGMIVMMKDNRLEGRAVLHCTGRDIEDQTIAIRRDDARWILDEEYISKTEDMFPLAMHDLMSAIKEYKGSPTELCKMLAEGYDIDVFPNKIKKKLVLNGHFLSTHGVIFKDCRSNGKRYFVIQYNAASDDSAGTFLMPEGDETDDTIGTGDEYYDAENGVYTGVSECFSDSKSDELAVPVADYSGTSKVIAGTVGRLAIMLPKWSIMDILRSCDVKIKSNLNGGRKYENIHICV